MFNISWLFSNCIHDPNLFYWGGLYFKIWVFGLQFLFWEGFGIPLLRLHRSTEEIFFPLFLWGEFEMVDKWIGGNQMFLNFKGKSSTTSFLFHYIQFLSYYLICNFCLMWMDCKSRITSMGCLLSSFFPPPKKKLRVSSFLIGNLMIFQFNCRDSLTSDL